MSKKKDFFVDIYDADHPSRRKAIKIIEQLIEPILVNTNYEQLDFYKQQGGLEGKEYHDLEDSITEIIEENNDIVD